MSQVSITLVRADTNQEFDVELPDDARISELLPALVKELGLPLTGPDGNQVAYELSNKRTGTELKENVTLGEAGTKTGDLMLLTSTFVAGGKLVIKISEKDQSIPASGPITEAAQTTEEPQAEPETEPQPEPEAAPVPRAKPPIKVGATIGIRKLTNAYDAYALQLVSFGLELQSRQRGKPRKWKVVAELPNTAEYQTLKTTRYTTTVETLIEDAYTEAEEVGTEMRDWHDNLPEGLQEADTGTRVSEAADTIENAVGEKPETSGTLGELAVVYLPGLKVTSRADRLSEAASMMREAISALEEYRSDSADGDHKVECDECDGSGTVACGHCGADDMEDCDKCDGSGKVDPEDEDEGDVDEHISTLENSADELEGVDCPGMFG